MKTFLITSSIVMLFAINCTSSANEETSQASLRGVLQNTTILIQTEEMYYGAISPQARNECYVKKFFQVYAFKGKYHLIYGL